jgi:hypothetical protein
MTKPHCFICSEPGTVPAIGSYDFVGLGDDTIPIHLCDRHADLLKDRVLTLRVEPSKPE